MTLERNAWLVMLTAFLAGVTVAVNQFKVPPVLPTLMATLQLDMVTGGWMMSIFSVASVVLAMPAAFLVTRLGPKRTGMIGLGCTVVGSAAGALAGNATALLVARVVEGVSAGLIAVVVPSVISLWFEPRKRGLPMGIWAAWVPLGNVTMFNAAHPLLAAFSWRAIWWFGALLALTFLVIFSLVVTVPRRARQVGDHMAGPPTFSRPVLLNPASWLLGLTFGTLTFCLIGYNTWAPFFLTAQLGVEPAIASFYASLMFVAGILANVAAGWIINRLKNRARLLVAAFVVTGVLLAWSFRLGEVSIVPVYMIALGFASNFIPTSVFTLAPETAPRPELVGLALATVNMGANLGVIAGPPLLGAILSRGYWAWGSACLVMVMSAGAFGALLLEKRIG